VRSFVFAGIISFTYYLAYYLGTRENRCTTKRFAAMKDGHWWSVVDLQTMKRVPCPLDYIGHYHYKKDAQLAAKVLNYKEKNND